MRRRFAILTAAAAFAAAAPAPAHAAPVLAHGSQGASVRAVQRALGLPADGIYGRQTARAVRIFQRSHHLPVTGRVDRRTRAALFVTPQSSPAPTTTTTGGARVTDPAVTASPADALVAAARSVIGRPYKAATAGPDGFDCSGLVVWAAGQAGITGMPRSSFEQYKAGTAVAGGEVLVGDLVFFDTGGPGASDVGIASGPDTVISATTHGVREHPLDGPYWGEHYVGARRL